MSLRSAVAHRNLLYLLSLKELRTRYKKSVLGWAWSLLNPLTQMGIFSVIFLYVFKATPPIGDPSGLKNFPLYFLSGALPFNFFAITVGVAIGSVQGGAGLIKKVQFPHEHLVFSVVVAQFVTLLIELVVLAVALLLAGNMVLPWLPVLLLVLGLLALFTTGVALMLSAANVFYHDVNYLWGILSQILFYSTPVIYNPAIIEVRALRFIANYGPTGSFITAVHNVVYDLRMPGNGRLLQLVVMSFAMFALGAWAFDKLSPRFAEEM
ncbi:MAG: putative polysaccharide ABC transporter permease protein [Acidimicrobiaceae bacterium]|nr:MAG: putative polysaccharide ABC transporter permease protein [Acidimicrobiaceae bacterium]